MKLSYFVASIASIAIILTAFVISQNIFAEKFFSLLNTIKISDNVRVISQISDISENDHITGNIDSDIILIEYSDYKCAICASIREIMSQLIREENVAIVYRNLYKDASSPGFYFAVIAECVYENLGDEKFNEISNYIYSEEDITRDEADFQSIKLGLTALKLEKCKNDKKIEKKILKESREAEQLGAVGTPFILFTNEGRITGFSYGDTYGAIKERLFDSLNK